jgi:integrase
VKGYIRRRSAGSWQVFVELGVDPVSGRRLRQSQNVRGNRRDAERIQAQLINAVDTGTYIDPRQGTVAEYLARWLRDYASQSVAPRTFEGYRRIVRTRIVPSLGSIRLGQLRPAHIVAAERSWLEGGSLHGGQALAPRTVVQAHRILREALQQAVRWQMLTVNPAEAVSPPRVPRGEMHAFNAAEAARFLQAASGNQEFGPLFTTAIYSGLRLGELRGLRWRDVDFEGSALSIQQTLSQVEAGLVFAPTKTHRSRRRVSIPASMVEVLRRHRAEQTGQRLKAGPAWQETDLVFADALGSPASEKRLRAAFEAAIKAADVPRIRIHDLRHTMATLMLSQGEHPKVVSERLGHATVGITLDTYSHVLPGLQAAAAERLATTLDAAAAADTGRDS